MNREEVQDHVNRYCHLRDVQFAAYELYARRHGLTAKELFVLDIIWFAPEGCRQSEICDRLSATKQTVSAILKKFENQGYVSFMKSDTDRRGKIIRLTDAGIRYVEEIIPPAAEAEVDAMCGLSGEDVRELVRLTALFSDLMWKNFGRIGEEFK